jgi:catechol 2,3-dioxygenase-like lactoylglutathione lyase family enzyme
MKKILFFSSIFLLSLSSILPAIASDIIVTNSPDQTVLIARSDRVYLEEDEDGNTCLRDRHGNKVYLEEDEDGNTFFEDRDGRRVYLEEDREGNVYFDDEDNDRVYVEEYSSRERSSRDRDIYVEDDDGNGIIIERR